MCIAETFLWPGAEKDGRPGVHSPGSVAELNASLEVWVPGQHEWRGLCPRRGVCHRTSRTGSFHRFGSVMLHKIRLYF